MSGYTAGPWAYIQPDGIVVLHPQVYSDTGPVCNATWRGPGKMPELLANCRLIAAAPDLLRSLEHAVSWYEDDDILPAWVLEAKAAISKATGGAA